MSKSQVSLEDSTHRHKNFCHGSASFGSKRVINNIAATRIKGTFSNLADGSIITIGSNTFQVSYEGGDGNDLTLTVVP